MTGSAWLVLALVLPAYFGAFLSGLRPGRWFGTRLLPLVATLCVPFVLSEASYMSATVSLVVTGLILAAWTTSICHVAAVRDYA
jgi:hypothetical protein